MQLVLRPDPRSHTNDKDVSQACKYRHDPDEHSLNDACQEVLQRRDSISVRFTAANVWRVSTVLEFLKISDVQREGKNKILN